MVLNNFKSYKGLLEIGPFHNRFSSIVGPNGSGKSNIIDSLLFVFGRRSSEIRFKRITDLVYKSQDNVSAGSCCVSIHFESILDGNAENQFESLPDSDFSVSREVTAKGQSKYRINEKVCPFREIVELLAKKGIDLNNNRFLILQGEVESIAQMKPVGSNENEKGLLEYLEEIIGSNRFVPKIDEALERLDSLAEERQQSLSRVKLVEKEKNSLESSRKDAIAFLEKDRELQKVLIQQQQIHLFYLNKGMECLESNQQKLLAQKDKAKLLLDGMNQSLVAINKEFEEEKNAYEKFDAQSAELMKRFNLLEAEDTSINVNVVFETKKGKKMKKHLKGEREKLAAAEERINLSRVELPKLERQLDELNEERKKRVEKLDGVISAVKVETTGVKVELEIKQRELAPFEEKVNKAKQNVDIAEGEIQAIQENAAVEVERNGNLSKRLGLLKTRMAKNKICRDSIFQKIKDGEESLERMENNLKKMNLEKSKIQPELQSVKEKFGAAKRAVENTRTSAGIVGKLMHQKEIGAITGIEGRLGSLGTIDSKYDVAVSTASSLLNSILVDSAETAAKCIDFLKKNRLGRASFMMLDKQQHFAAKIDQPLETPENAPRLFDLVRPSSRRYRPAFYCALRDTLFAQNIDQAVRLSSSKGRRWRVVTSRGELVDTSGTMSGGGRAVKRGVIGSQLEGKIDESHLKELEESFAKLSERYRKLTEAKENLSKRFEALRVEQSQNKLQKRKLEIDLENDNKSLAKLIKESSSSASTLKTVVSKANDRIFQLKNKVEKFKAELSIATKSSIKVRKEVKALEDEIYSRGGNKVKEEKNKLRRVEETINEVMKKMSEMKVEVSMGERKTKNSRAKIATAETQLEVVKAKLAELNIQSTRVETRAKALLEENKVQKSLRDEKKKQMEAKTKELHRCEEESKELRMSMVDFDDQLRDFANNRKTNETKIAIRKKKRDELMVKLKRTEAVLNNDHEELNGIDQRRKEGEGEREDDNSCGVGEEKRLKWDFKLTEEGQLPPGEKDQLEKEEEELKAELKAMNPNMSVIEEYQTKMGEYRLRVESLDQATQRADDAKKDYDEFRLKRMDEFMAGFSVITKNLKEMYQLLTMGGDAELECVDRFDPFAEGIEFSVRPPKKSWKNISNLSGGEKTLSSLALVFALHHYKPTPLYVMDEIDAALDFKNVAVVAQYVRKRTRDAQFIIVSLRNSMFESAHRLVGVYKPETASMCMTIDPDTLENNS